MMGLKRAIELNKVERTTTTNMNGELSSAVARAPVREKRRGKKREEEISFELTRATVVRQYPSCYDKLRIEQNINRGELQPIEKVTIELFIPKEEVILTLKLPQGRAKALPG